MSLELLGPLKNLIGTWEGDKGDDIAPSDDRQTEQSLFRERLVFEDVGLVDNHEQLLYGVRYQRNAWRLSNGNLFHQENGFWMWDSHSKQVFTSFTIPRGVTVLAGGSTTHDSNSFSVKADAGSETYGICSNPFLIEEFKTVKFEMNMTFKDANTLSYDQTTFLKMKGREDLFLHTDKNTLSRV